MPQAGHGTVPVGSGIDSAMVGSSFASRRSAASVLRTRYLAEVRRCADMTESILGRRPPAWAVRGLA